MGLLIGTGHSKGVYVYLLYEQWLQRSNVTLAEYNLSPGPIWGRMGSGGPLQIVEHGSKH